MMIICTVCILMGMCAMMSTGLPQTLFMLGAFLMLLCALLLSYFDGPDRQRHDTR